MGQRAGVIPPLEGEGPDLRGTPGPTSRRDPPAAGAVTGGMGGGGEAALQAGGDAGAVRENESRGALATTPGWPKVLVLDVICPLRKLLAVSR